jgi:hypothetical protein
MLRLALSLFLAVALSGCVSLTAGGAAVKVYETDRPASDSAARLPTGCKLISSDSPIDQQASERLVEDPYRIQRNATAEKGGNVLLLRSRVSQSLPKTDCPTGDRSVDCQERLGTWYRVQFESYRCDEPALAALAASGAETSGKRVAWWWPFGSKKKEARPAAAATPVPPPAPVAAAPAAPAPATASAGLTPAELKAKVLDLMRENVSPDVIVAYVRSRRVATPLSAEEIIDWKKAGIAEPVIEAAIAQASR